MIRYKARVIYIMVRMVFARIAFFLLGGSLLLAACQTAPSNTETAVIDSLTPARTELSGQQLAATYCASCHLLPNPALLDKKTWQNSVLPQMALRLGQSDAQSQELMQYRNLDELKRVVTANIFPEHPTMHPADWQKLVEYYTANAPDILPPQPKHAPVLPAMLLFNARQSTSAINPVVTVLRYDSIRHQIWAGDAGMNLYALNKQLRRVDSVEVYSPVLGVRSERKGVLDLLSVGLLDPNDQSAGDWQRRKGSNTKPMAKIGNLQRPVYSTTADLNRDGQQDIVICQFGHHFGKLTWHEKQRNGDYREHVLDEVPGARVALVRDVNHDGWPDVVALLSQGDEQVAVYHNLRNSLFKKQILLRFPAVYGSSFLEMTDIDQDGDLDLIYTNGDNADYSIILKPYHGIRIFLNDGKFKFTESFFFPMYGATQTVTRDFDQDGDLDIAAIAHFPDFSQHPNQSFVYLENSGGLTFKPQTFPMANRGRWFVMDVGDLDQDGDEDILLGSFYRSAHPKYAKLMEYWRQPGTGVMLLENTVK